MKVGESCLKSELFKEYVKEDVKEDVQYKKKNARLTVQIDNDRMLQFIGLVLGLTSQSLAIEGACESHGERVVGGPIYLA